MVDERPEETELPPDSGRPKREPPTIDLEASEVSGTTTHADCSEHAQEAVQENVQEATQETTLENSRETSEGNFEKNHHEAGADASDQPASTPPRSSGRPLAFFLTAMVSGAGAAALVIGAASYLGWTTIGPGAPVVSQNAPAPQLNAAAIDDLTARVARIEKSGESRSDANASAPPVSQSGNLADAARLDALEKSIESLRGEIAGARTASGKPADASPAPPPDLSPINDRITKLEQAIQAERAEIAKQSARAAEARPTDDIPLRRVVMASLLDISVRQGEPYAAALAAAKSLAPDAAALKPLEGFASSGVPTTNALSRELLTLVPKLSPGPPQNASPDAGIIDRLQAGAARLVRIERSDVVGNDRSAIVARVTAAALRNDSAEARRELKTLSNEDRAAAQSWIDKADARDAALAAARQFAADAMAALAKPSQ